MAETKISDRRDGKGYSFFSGGSWHMVRCHKCGLENYALAVITGACYSCGFNANKSEVEDA